MQGKSVKHAHASYAHIILQMSLIHKVKFVPKHCTNAYYFSLSYGQRENPPKKKYLLIACNRLFWWCTQMLRCDITIRVCTSLLDVCLLHMHMFLKFERSSTRLFSEKKSFFTPGHYWFWVQIQKTFIPVWFCNQGWFFAWHILSGINRCCVILPFLS